MATPQVRHVPEEAAALLHRGEEARVAEPSQPATVLMPTADDLLAAARNKLDRVEVAELDAERAMGALVVDIRPESQRRRDGELPGAVVIDRNVLEWRLDPRSPQAISQVSGYDQRIIIVCNEGYASSLVAAELRQLGLVRATDLIGGFQAWLASYFATS